MTPTTTHRSVLYHERTGHGVPILLVPPSGATSSTWGRAVEDLASIGSVITYDRRGYARSGGPPVHSARIHTTDAADLLECLGAVPAVVVGTSAGASIAVDLAVRRPDLVRAVIAHEAAWRATHHVPSAAQLQALVKVGWFALRGRHGDATETLLRAAYTYRDGGTAWDAFPENWRTIARENARPALADFRNSIGDYPSATDLATIAVPVICTHGARSPDSVVRLTRSLAAAVPGARLERIAGSGHAVAFDAPHAFVQLVAATIAL